MHINMFSFFFFFFAEDQILLSDSASSLAVQVKISAIITLFSHTHLLVHILKPK